MKIARRIILEYRKKKGFTQLETATKMGMPLSTYGYKEKISDFNDEQQKSLMKELGIPSHFLMQEKLPPQPDENENEKQLRELLASNTLLIKEIRAYIDLQNVMLERINLLVGISEKGEQLPQYLKDMLKKREGGENG